MISKEKLKFLIRYINDEFKEVDLELEKWSKFSSRFSEGVLAYQANESILHKRFHCLGGSVYALYPDAAKGITKFIVAYQTISDYLDNLCDRAGITDEKAFRKLHCAMTDALKLEDEFDNYYEYYGYTNDGGYLKNLISDCKIYLRKVPSYNIIKDKVIEFATLYSDLQVYKHIDIGEREMKLREWSKSHLNNGYLSIKPWEFWATTGSTLSIFSLVALAGRNDLNLSEVEKTAKAYFPWVNGIHILLDYFIDMEEDLGGGDLNFINYYKSKEEFKDRMLVFINKAFNEVKELAHPEFHRTVIEGMLAMYLSDPKIYKLEDKKISKYFLSIEKSDANSMHKICKLLRKLNTI